MGRPFFFSQPVAPPSVANFRRVVIRACRRGICGVPSSLRQPRDAIRSLFLPVPPPERTVCDDERTANETSLAGRRNTECLERGGARLIPPAQAAEALDILITALADQWLD